MPDVTRAPPPEPRRNIGLSSRGWYAIIVLATALCRLPSFIRKLSDSDEAIYGSVAALVNSGGTLYLDGGVDMKCPGIFWTYAAAFKMAGQYAMGAVHLLTLLVVLATAAIIGRGAASVSGPQAGYIAALFYGVFSSVFYPQMLAANTEVFMMLPLCASAVLVLESSLLDVGPRRVFWSALLIGVACAWKQVALVNAPLLVAVALVSPRRWACVLAGAGGIVVGVGGWLLATWRWSSVPDMWHWAFVRVATHYGPDAWSLARYASNLSKTGGLFLISTTPLWLALLATKGRPWSSQQKYLIAWCALSCVAVGSSGHFFGHYYLQLIGPLSLFAGIEWSRRGLPRPIALATVLTGLSFFVVAIVYDPIEGGFRRGPRAYVLAAEYVRLHTSPEDRIFVWGYAAPLYVAADRLPATRFVGFLRGIDRAAHESAAGAWDSGDEVWPLLLKDFAAHPPTMIVDTAPANLASYRDYPITLFPTIRSYLSEYVKETTVAGVDIYRRRTGRAPREARAGDNLPEP